MCRQKPLTPMHSSRRNDIFYNTFMAQHPDVLIVGGGVIGLTTAYVLAKEGMSVELLDKGELGMEASWAGAGIIPPGNPDRAGSAYDRLRATSSRMFPAFSKELLDLTGIDNGYRICGGIEFLQADDLESVPAWQAEEVPFELLSDSGFEYASRQFRPSRCRPIIFAEWLRCAIRGICARSPLAIVNKFLCKREQRL